MSVKKRFVILIVLLLGIILTAFVYSVATGGSYSLHSRAYLPNEEAPEASVTFENDGIVELTGTRMENGELVYDFRALKSGKTTAYLTYVWETEDEKFQMTVPKRELTVTPLNVIICDPGLDFNGSFFTIICMVIAFALIFAFAAWSFLDCRKRGNFSYVMTACGGVAIFSAVFDVFLIYKIMNNVVHSTGDFLLILYEISNELLLGLTPIMIVTAVLIAISNIWLLRHEGYRPVNALGIIFGILLLAATAYLSGEVYFFNLRFPGDDTVRLIVKYSLCYLYSMFVSTMACAILATNYKPPYDRDYIIILGCGIRSDGTLTPLLKGRVDSALNFEKEQFEAAGKHAVFVPSGGQGADEVISEAQAMTNYLLSQGVPPESILPEDKSTNTFENMQFSRRVIEENTDDFGSAKIAFATTNYHIFRGYILARKNGFDAKGISAKTKFYFYPNAFLREFIGLLYDQKFKHLAVLTLIVLFFVGLGAVLH